MSSAVAHRVARARQAPGLCERPCGPVCVAPCRRLTWISMWQMSTWPASAAACRGDRLFWCSILKLGSIPSTVDKQGHQSLRVVARAGSPMCSHEGSPPTPSHVGRRPGSRGNAAAPCAAHTRMWSEPSVHLALCISLGSLVAPRSRHGPGTCWASERMAPSSCAPRANPPRGPEKRAGLSQHHPEQSGPGK